MSNWLASFPMFLKLHWLPWLLWLPCWGQLRRSWGDIKRILRGSWGDLEGILRGYQGDLKGISRVSQHRPLPLASRIQHCLPAMAAIMSRDEPSWLVAAVSERLGGSTLLLLLHSLPQATLAGQQLPLHLWKSLTSGSFRQSLVLPRLMVRYFWWRQSP